MPRSKRKPEADPAEASPNDVRRRAMDLLARREHSRRELETKLSARGLPRALIEEALDALAEEGLQSDARFAESFVHHRVGRGQGPLRIRQELASRGVAEVHGEQLLSGYDEEAWRELAEQARSARFGEAAPASWEEKVKQAKFLERRGFALGHIRIDVVEE